MMVMMAVSVAMPMPMAVPVVMPMPVRAVVMRAVVVVIVVVVVVGCHRSLCLTAAAPDQWTGLRPTSASARRVAAESRADQSLIRVSICAPSASRGT